MIGDILSIAEQGGLDVLVHGCNCQCTMGAGLAKQIRLRYPEAYAADLQTLRNSREKLGTYSCAVIERQYRFVIVNGYTQFHWTGPLPRVDYTAVRQVFQAVRRDFPDARIAYPRIGAGLAGGDWRILREIISTTLSGCNHFLVEKS